MASLSGTYVHSASGTVYKGKLTFYPAELRVQGTTVITGDPFVVQCNKTTGAFSVASILPGDYEVRTDAGTSKTIRILDDGGTYDFSDCIISPVAVVPSPRYVFVGYIYNPDQGGYQQVSLVGASGAERLSFGAINPDAPAGLVIDRLWNADQEKYQRVEIRGLGSGETPPDPEYIEISNL